MTAADPRIDAYIASRADFARPVLEHLRAALHAACPELVETVRWGMPHFDYRGRPLAMMAAFKAHCAFGFWQGSQVTGAARGASAMGQFGRITARANLPGAREFRALVRKAMALIDSGVKPPRAPKTGTAATGGRKPPLPMPAELAAALKRDAAARRGYDALPPGRQREYREWIAEAKRADTRERRLAQSVQWLADGKALHWKYERR